MIKGGETVKKHWLIAFLFLTGCSKTTEQPVVEEKTPQQQLTAIQQDIKKELDQLQLIIGETEQQDLQNYEQIDDRFIIQTNDFNVTIHLENQLVNEITVFLPEQVKVKNIETIFTFDENIQGQWQIEAQQVKALKLVRTVPTFKQQVYGLPLEKKIGQMLMIGMNGTSISPELKGAIEQQIGNVILFKKNITSIEQLRVLITDIDALASDFPIWVAIDEEGGTVSRLPDELVKLPSANILASKYSEQQVKKIAEHLGVAIAYNGIDIDFAPVMDVNSNLANPVIGKRAFSDKVDTVSRYASQFASGLQQAGVIAVAKHFPGHGDTDVDSHKGLPVIHKSLEQLQQLELRPFQQAIEQGIDSIMIGHLLVPALDKHHPASLSSNIVTGLLREQMKYDGILFTDDLTMGALQLSLPKAIVASIQAGNDIALANGTLDEVLEGKKLVMQAVEQGVIPLKQINESVYRILKKKKQQPLQDFQINEWNERMRLLLKQ